ncbi:MAG: phosphoribosylanthranilate isomerase [Dehalococcoidia bacterium]|nr:MAG: phosphoribosylanthranilate isomerase [Dehalococcoidia bacterium]
MTRVKICGITDVAHAQAAAEAGTDLIGVVFAPSPRRVTPEKAKEIAAAAKEHGLPVVGVFVNTPAAEVNSLAADCGLDWVQLSGDEDTDCCRQVRRPLIKAVHIAPDWDEEQLLAHLESSQRELRHHPPIYLLDTQVEEKYGGTGKAFPWDIARPAAEKYPVIIAGGLDPENVGRVVTELKPWGVDVSSGVESGGTKDIEKIKAFVAAVRRAKAMLYRAKGG